MMSIVAALAIAVAVSAATTPLVRKVALAIGAVDAPTARRVHTQKIPRLGGIAIVLGFFLPLVLLFALNTSLAQLLFARTRVVAGLIVGSLVVVSLGAIDDVIGLGAKRKLLVQTFAAGIVYASGLRIDIISLPTIGVVHLGWFGFVVTIAWIVGVINALNLIDGLDGLAAGVAFFACITNFVIAYLGNNVLVCLLSATLAGTIVGFLIHNFNPATIFMGDSGSMFLGFMLAAISIFGAGSSQKGGTAIAIFVPILALGLPIVDTLFAMGRRVLERRSIFSPDRGHIHHRLLDLGLTHRRAVLILYGASVVFTLGALAMHLLRSWQMGVVLIGLTVTLIGLVRFVGYFNYNMMLRQQRERRREPGVEALRRAVPTVLTRIETARSPDDLEELFGRFASEAKLLAVEMQGPGQGRSSWRWEAPELGPQHREAVQTKYPVKDAGGIELQLTFQWDSASGAVSPQSEILLQLVADATERLLQRPARARDAARTGRLRPIA
jgi:UDP-GlcNAc:undecaprenyl-phosphate/decaprenyl-phosphate GlcNAc-1-phosphate transferase